MKCFSALEDCFLSACDFTARTVKYTNKKHYANPQQQQQQQQRVQIFASYLLCVMHSQPPPASPLKTASIRQFIRVHWGSRDKWGYLSLLKHKALLSSGSDTLIVLLSFKTQHKKDTTSRHVKHRSSSSQITVKKTNTTPARAAQPLEAIKANYTPASSGRKSTV